MQIAFRQELISWLEHEDLVSKALNLKSASEYVLMPVMLH